MAVLTALEALGRFYSLLALAGKGLGFEKEAITNKLISCLNTRHLDSYYILLFGD